MSINKHYLIKGYMGVSVVCLIATFVACTGSSGPAATSKNSDRSTSSAETGNKGVQTPLFVIKGDASAIYWEPNLKAAVYQVGEAASYANLDLTVSGPTGKIIKQRFTPDQPVKLGAEAGGFTDGLYKWQTVAAPVIDPSVRKEMAAVRESGDLAAEQALIARLRGQGVLPTEEQARDNVQSGHFTIRDGALLPSDIIEQ